MVTLEDVARFPGFFNQNDPMSPDLPNLFPLPVSLRWRMPRGIPGSKPKQVLLPPVATLGVSFPWSESDAGGSGSASFPSMEKRSGPPSIPRRNRSKTGRKKFYELP